MNETARELPHDQLAEQSVLGCLFKKPEALPLVRRIISSPLMFSTTAYGMIFRCICKVADRHEPVDQVSVGHELMRLDYLEKAGGVTVFNTLEERASLVANVENYAKIIRKTYAYREVIRAGQQVIELGHSNPEEPDEMFQAAKSAVTAACGSAEYVEGAISLEQGASLVWEHLDKGDGDHETAVYIPLGIHGLEIPRGLVTTLGGRTTNGKTAMVMNWELHMARQGYKVLHMSLEDNARRYTIRIMANLAEVENTKIGKGLVSGEERQRLLDAANEMSNIPIHICAKKSPSIEFVKQYTAAHQATKGCDVLVVDFVQLVSGKRGQSKYDKVTEAMQELIVIAEELDIAVIAVSQVSRPTEKGGIPRPPTMFDLKESGEIENLSKVIFMVHRPSVYDKDADPTLLMLNAVKVSDGPFGNWTLRGYMPHMKVGEMETRVEEDNRGGY